MPAWLTLYCRESVDEVTGEAILEALKGRDWHSLAEDLEIEDEDVVNSAISQLRFDPRGEDFHYREAGMRPLVMHRWTKSARVAEEIEEVEDRFEEGVPEGLAEHLKQVVSVVGIEMGFGQIDDMGRVIAIEIGVWFMRHKGALMLDHDGSWYLKDDDGWHDLF